MSGVLTVDRPPQPATRYTVSLARDEDEVRAAQRLRHDVFAGELGVLLSGPRPGLDSDAFDAYCDHLLVREETTGQVVGTYRLLPPERAAVAGRLYSEGEFDLGALDPLRPELVEVGRSCVHPGHRDGAVIGLIWAGIARYMTDRGYAWLAGCCSIPLTDGGTLAAATWDRVRERHLAPAEYRVRPLLPWTSRPAVPAASAVPAVPTTPAVPAVPTTPAVPAARTDLPALLRGYLRLGAWVCGEPAHDPDFGVADLYVLLPMSRVHPRYLRHFLSLAPAAR
ncbi:GNAT family N-acyltransferase [Streptomyces sp. NPDC005876]|uniref:GNAT family N-acetyltransferase n=1 Tax=Streptomyces sp. NPDC005876 TaxID=3157076 RepID=UPI0033CC9673